MLNKFLTIAILFLSTIILTERQSQAQQLVQRKNYHGGYNYYFNNRMIFQSRQGFGREHLYKNNRKIGEIRSFGSTKKLYLSRPIYSFKNGKINVKKKY